MNNKIGKCGAKLKFKTAKALRDAVDEYFKDRERPTMSGLALHLKLSRQSLINYESRTGFGDIIKEARQKVEESFEEALYGTAVSGVIFNLKNNFGWRDKTEVEQHSTHKLDMSDMSDEELERIAKGG